MDGVILIVPDYVQDIQDLAHKVLSRMRDLGVTCRIGQT